VDISLQTAIGLAETSAPSLQTAIGLAETSAPSLQTAIGLAETSAPSLQTAIGLAETSAPSLQTAIGLPETSAPLQLQVLPRASQTQVLVIGSLKGSTKLAQLFKNGSESSYAVIGFISTDAHGQLQLRRSNGVQFCDRLDPVLDEYPIDEVVQLEPCVGIDADSLSYACAIRGITLKRVIQSPLGEIGRYSTRNLGNGEYLLSLEIVPTNRVALSIKRGIDIVAALFGLMVCGVAWLAFARRIRRQSRGSVFFKQIRVGRNGRHFQLYKFRTMCVTAEDQLAQLAAQNEMKGHIFKMHNDPRVTPLGRFLRRHHLDELPQFWNVLRGDMSLVGTRPPLPQEVAKYSAHHQRRLSMKPGITGPWQLAGIKKINDFEEIVRLDCKYIDSWSLWQDCKIILGTVFKLCRGDGC
jgi:exopolysaccharide biosynthesis polyprenyl glycosylphosphotransferase